MHFDFGNPVLSSIGILTVILKILYCVALHYKCRWDSAKQRNRLVFLSIYFPVIIGIICLIKHRKNTKNDIIIVTSLLLFLLSFAAVFGVNYYYTSHRYYDKNHVGYAFMYEVVHYDRAGNTYTYDFEKTAYDYLYINNTQERLNTDWCYLDSDGYVVYDDDMSITVKDKNSCVDTDGQLYYPVQFTTFNKDGTMEFAFNSNNFDYDRLGKAYTYDYVPYYDSEGNKYYYYFDTNLQKGFYVNLLTGESFDNEYSFVDDNGYLVYDSRHSFVEKEDALHQKIFIDKKNKKIYYWASSVSWNKNGQMFDIKGKEILDNSV